MADSDNPTGSGSSSSEQDVYMSAAEDLSLSQTPHHYETPDNDFHAELADDNAKMTEDREKDAAHSQAEVDDVNNHVQDGEERVECSSDC